MLSFIKVPEPAAAPSNPEDPSPRMGVGLTTEHLDEVDLLDPTPLFLPTKVNAAPLGPQRLRIANRGSFKTFPPVFSNPVSSVELSFPPIADVPTTVGRGLRVGEQPNPYRTFGEGEPTIEPLPKRLAYVDVVPARGGETVLSMAVPAVEDGPKAEWHPMEWIVAVDRKGLMGSLALAVSSGSEEGDLFFRRYLADGFRLGNRLDPGLYRVRISP
ncbi:MAG TPA: hypothetical protein PLN52_10190 [Opitutaceae bacterium]|nr:hypothetical protein [Opitutaceae bacterium]